MFLTEKKMKAFLEEILGVDTKRIPQLVKEIKELVGPKEQIPKLKKELEELKLKKEMEERDIKHLVKLKEEKLDIEHQKKELVLKGQFKDKEMKLQTNFHDKILVALAEARTEMKEVYEKIMERLPNVNVEMGINKRKK